MRLRTYYNYPHKIQISTTKHKNSCRRQQQVTTWRVLCDDRRVLNESPGVQGPKPLVLFPRLFQKSRALRGQRRNQGGFALD